MITWASRSVQFDWRRPSSKLKMQSTTTGYVEHL
jgi:hypothetical protein